jgi:hypothetical protein
MPYQGEDQPPDSDTLNKIAVELYQRDARRQWDAAVQGGPNEAKVPDSYYQEANVEFYRRQLREQNQAADRRAKNRIALWAALFAVLVIGPILIRPISNLLHKPVPFTIGFADIPRSWRLSKNDGTVANISPTTADGQPAIRVAVDKFTISHSGKFAGQCWAQAITTTGPFDLRKLNQMTFKARGSGLSHVRMRFNFNREDAVSKNFDLTEQWETYAVDLNELTTYRLVGGQFVPVRGKRVADTVQSVEVQVGHHINPLDSHGYVEVGKLEFH